MNDPFAPRAPDDVADLVLRHPLGWVVSSGAEGPLATLLPIRPVMDEQGNVRWLEGHFARRNSQVEALRREGRALFLFLGPQGYLSPSWFGDRSQAPTWNYAGAQFLADVTLYEDEPSLRAHLEDLIGANEAGRPAAWRLEETGDRYKGLVRGIVGFRAAVTETRAKFKLGQDERDDVFADMVRGLQANGGGSLAEWMLQFRERPDEG